MINQALHKCLKNGVKIYPIYKDYRWYIQININGKIKTIDKTVSQNKINEAVTKTYIFYAEKL